ncbi:MAG: hypothetical protein AAGA48_02930 [Myxococcota bacterium]
MKHSKALVGVVGFAIFGCSQPDMARNGTRLPVVEPDEHARGFVYGDIEGHTLGSTVACGPDVDGNGLGDVSFTADNFDYQIRLADTSRAIYRANGPLVDRVRHDEIDGWHIREGALLTPSFGHGHVLLEAPHPAGLLFVGTTNDLDREPEQDGTQMARFARTNEAEVADVRDAYINFAGTSALNAQLLPDLNGDGLPEVALGHNRFGVLILTAPPNGEVDVEEAAWATLGIPEENSTAIVGSSLLPGDFDGDGSTDLSVQVIGADHPFPGEVVVVFGPLEPGSYALGTGSRELAIDGLREAGLTRLGQASGDLNGDGIDDLILATHTGPDGGWVRVYFGPLMPGILSADSADVVLAPEQPGAWFGTSVVVGDFDGSGDPALAIGASMNGFYDEDAPPGLVYVMRAPFLAGARVPDDVQTVLQGKHPRDNFGWSLAACDTDRDGRDELVIGATDHTERRRAQRGGAVYHSVVPP